MSQTKAQLIDTLVASLLPASDSSVDLGSNAVRFANIYGDTLYGSGANLTGLNIVTDTSPQLGGNLDVNTKNILFGDSASASDDRLIVGTGGDLHVYHDGTDTYVSNATGDLRLFSVGGSADDVIIRAQDDVKLQPNNGEAGIQVIGDGAVELYYDASKKLETDNSGVTISGRLETTSNVKAKQDGIGFRSGAGDDLQIFHDGTDSFVQNNTGQLILRTATVESAVVCKPNGAVELYYDNSKKFETASGGISVVGQVDLTRQNTANEGGEIAFRRANDNTKQWYIDVFGSDNNARLRFHSETVHTSGRTYAELTHDEFKVLEGTDLNVSSDSGKLLLGASGDLEIYHDGSKNYIRGATASNIDIRTAADFFITHADTDGSNAENCIVVRDDGEVELYYDGSKKLETTSTGVSVTGNVQLQDDGEVRLGTNNDIRMFHANGNANFIQSYNDVDLRIHTFGSTAKIRLQNNESENAIVCNPNDSVELYHNGNRQVFTIDGGMNWQDTKKAEFGNSGDLKIYHDGNHSYIQDTGTGKLRLTTNSFRLLETDNSSPMITADENGAVTLNYDGSKKFETLSSGVTISGGGLNVQRSSDAYSAAIYFAGFGDTNHVVWQDHYDNPNGTRGTGNGFDGIKWNCYAGFQLFRGNEAETIAKFLGNGACELYFDNVKQINTHPNGIFTRGIYPMNDNSHNIGSGSERFNTIFATNSSINTSDITEKNTIVNSDLGLDFINKLNPISYKWNKDDGKTHYGLIAQDVEETLISIGKTVSDFGGIHKEDNSPMGLGYSELIAPLIKAIQELSAEVAALKAA